jgi:hypothetical protein
MEIPQFGEKLEANGFTFRWAQPSDSELFAKWASENDKIPRKDILSSMSVNNPTCVFFVIEKDGVPVVYAPFHARLILDFLGFNPESGRKDRLEALSSLQNVISEFALIHGIREIAVESAKDYPVAKWAVKNGFEPEPRETFKLRVTPLVNPEVEAHYDVLRP